MKFKYTLLYVDDVEKSMDFYAQAFGLEKGFMHESKGYGEMVTGETKLGFVHHDTASSHGFQYDRTSIDSKIPGFDIGFVADDVAVAFENAVKAGASPVSEPETKPWGQTVAFVRDCNGFLVEFGSPIG